MEVCNKMYLLKKTYRKLRPEEILFFKKSGIIYAGQFSMPDVFFSEAANCGATIILFDPRGYDDFKYVNDMLCSLQEFTDCKIILAYPPEKGLEPTFKYVHPNPNIEDRMLGISDCLLKIKKEQENNPTNEKKNFYANVQYLLSALGFDNGHMGYAYLLDAIYYVYYQKTFNIRLVAEVYKYVANRNETTDSRVERDIRTAITYAEENCNHKALQADPKLRCFDKLMTKTSCKCLIQAVVSFLKYNTVFV